MRPSFRPLFLFCAAVCLMSVCRCGILVYPGQPGLVTNGYSKIDMEDLEEEGLYVYEATYDNRPDGKGVGTLVTKLYPGAMTYTSNVRTNMDGSVYREKGQYNGALVEMISIPSLNQVIVPPNGTVQFFLTYATSLNEVDDRNIAEESLFSHRMMTPMLSDRAYAHRKMLWDLMKAGTLTRSGSLMYDVASVSLNAEKFVPSHSVTVETTIMQTGMRTNLGPGVRGEMIHFLEEKFPTGFKGVALLNLKGVESALPMNVGMHSLKTAAAAGIQVIQQGRPAIEAMAKRLSN